MPTVSCLAVLERKAAEIAAPIRQGQTVSPIVGSAPMRLADVALRAPYVSTADLAFGSCINASPARTAPVTTRIAASTSSGGSFLEWLKNTFAPSLPGEVTEPGQSAKVLGGVAVLIPYSAIDLKTRTGLTPEQLLKKSQAERTEYYFARNKDGDELVVPTSEFGGLVGQLPEQTLHFHTHPELSAFTADGLKSIIPHVFSPADLTTYSQLSPGMVRGVFAPNGVLLFLPDKDGNSADSKL